MSEPTTIEGLHAWLLALPPEFAFLLVLPFLVATAGLLRVTLFGKPGEKAIAEDRSGNNPGQIAAEPVVYLKPSSGVKSDGNETSSQRALRDGTLRKGAAS